LIRNLITIFCLSFIIFTTDTFAKNAFSIEKYDKKDELKDNRLKHSLCKQTFKDFAKGLSNSNVSLITIYFESEVYLNLVGTEKGYYSNSHAELILNEFMNYFKVFSFKYKRSHRSDNYAYASGVYKYNKGSGTVELQVSISLKYNKNKWYINQININ